MNALRSNDPVTWATHFKFHMQRFSFFLPYSIHIRCVPSYLQKLFRFKELLLQKMKRRSFEGINNKHISRLWLRAFHFLLSCQFGIQFKVNAQLHDCKSSSHYNSHNYLLCIRLYFLFSLPCKQPSKL